MGGQEGCSKRVHEAMVGGGVCCRRGTVGGRGQGRGGGVVLLSTGYLGGLVRLGKHVALVFAALCSPF